MTAQVKYIAGVWRAKLLETKSLSHEHQSAVSIGWQNGLYYGRL
jgi:hypothetical protein